MLLQIKNGRKKFQNETILENINLEIRQGEFIALLGASGSGKTTLLRLLAGLETWSEGEFLADQRTHSAFVFQEPNLLSWRTVLENLQLPAELSHQPVDRSTELSVLKSVRLGDAAHLFPHELSGGMKMRASIARALITKPNLLFMDEPFSALDEPTREELQEQLRQIWESTSTTIVFVTHSLAEAVFLANRIIILDGKPAAVAKDYPLNLPQQRASNVRTTESYFSELTKVRALFQNPLSKRVP